MLIWIIELDSGLILEFEFLDFIYKSINRIFKNTFIIKFNSVSIKYLFIYSFIYLFWVQTLFHLLNLIF